MIFNYERFNKGRHCDHNFSYRVLWYYEYFVENMRKSNWCDKN